MDHNPFSLTNMLPEEVILHGNVIPPWILPRRCSQTKSAIVVLKYCIVHYGGGCKVYLQLGPNHLDKFPQR